MLPGMRAGVGLMGGAAASLKVQDVFAVDTWTGNATNRSIANGIDLSGKGGLAWIKNRSSSTFPAHYLFDTAQGATNWLSSNSTSAQSSSAITLTAFNSNGYSLGVSDRINENAQTFVGCSFRKAAKFFDVVTWTGNGSARSINHSLGIAPGLVVIKRTDSASTTGWAVYHRSATGDLYLNLTNAQAGSQALITGASSTTFSVGTSNDVNGNTFSYVAYLFAHDPDTTNGIVQCGNLTTDGSGAATVTLGWEPQYFMFKASSSTSNWFILDQSRSFTGATSDKSLSANLSNAETSIGSSLTPTSTGVTITGIGTSTTYIYMAVRKGPM